MTKRPASPSGSCSRAGKASRHFVATWRGPVRKGGFGRLRDFGVPEDELGEVAEAVDARAGNQANPRPATPDEIVVLLRSIA